MPSLPAARDAAVLQIDSLAPRDADPAALVAYAADEAIRLGGVTGSPVEKRATLLEERQIVFSIIPTYYKVDGPASGTVVGIVLGSVAGFLLLIWLFYSLANINNAGGGANIAGEEEIVVRRRRNSHSGRSRRSTRTEVREYSRSPRRSGGREQIIVEERRAAPRSTRTRSIIVEERARVPGDDVVEVIEEHDDYRSRRGSRRY